jgi:transposase
VFIGLDVSLSKTAVCVVDRDGVVLWQGKVASEPGPLVARLAEWSGVIDLAGIEACPLSEWLHRGLREAGIPVVCIEVRHARRFLSSRPGKTDRNDARGIAEMMRLGHYRPVHVKSPAAQSMRTTLTVRMQLIASQLQIEGTIRGLLKVYGLKIGAIHRNRFAARVVDLLEMPPSQNCRQRSSGSYGCGRACARNEERSIEPLPGCRVGMTSLAA